MSANDNEYDLFISYAHADNHNGWLTAMVEAIRAEHARFTSRPLRIFFDQDDITSMDDWEHRILRGLRESKIMLAALSPAYFQSEYCRKEWEIYIDHELSQQMPGEAIAPIYIVTHDEFEQHAEQALNEWMRNLKRRQYVDVRPWWDEGPQALERQDVRQRLELMDQQIGVRLERLTRARASPTTVPDHNPNFVGRDEELRKVRESLALGRVGAITALQGIGGMGKSALAFEYAHAYAQDYPDGRYLISCEGEGDLREALLKLVPQLGIELTEAEQRNLDAAAAHVKSVLNSHRRTLLILDNVDDPQLLAPQQCSRYLPDRAKVHVLATTRMGSDRMPGIECLALDALSDEAAVKLLEMHRPFSNENRDDEWKAALRIVRRLDGHCLAVEVVAVFLWKNPDISYQDYLLRLEAEGLAAVEGAAGDESVQLSRNTEKLLGSLIEPTLSALPPEELSAVESAALLPPDNIPLPWLKHLVGGEFPEAAGAPRPGYPDPWLRVTRRLIGLRLLTRNDESKTCRMHRLVQEVVRRRMDEVAAKRKRLLQLHVRDRAKFLWENWVHQENRWEIRPLVDYTCLLFNSQDTFGAWIASQLSEPLKQLGRFLDARGLLRQAVALREAAYDAGHPKLAASLSNLAMMERALGDLDAARDLLQRAITIWEKAHKPDHPVLASGYSNLSTIERALGDYESARRMAAQAITIWENANPPDERSLAKGYSNLAIVKGYLANLESARELHQKSVAIKEKLYKPDHPELATSFSDLASIERNLANFSSARDLSRRAIAIKEKVYDADHPTLADSYAGLAAIEKDLANFEEVKNLWRQAIAIREKAYDADHRILATSYMGLASVERDLANFAVSHELHERAIAIREKAHHADHPTLAASYASLASLEQDLAHYPQARVLHERALAAREKALDSDHPTLASSYSALASLEKTLANFAEARKLYEKALEIRTKAFHAEHPVLAGSYSSLASLEQDLANYDQARKLHEQALAIRTKTFKQDHPVLAGSFAGIATLERELGNHAKAFDLQQQVLAIREKFFPPGHPTLASSFSSLAGLESDQGNRQAARDLHQKALQIREKVFEPDHPVLASSYSALGAVECGLGNLAEALALHQKALAIREGVFESSHPLIAASFVGMSTVQRALGNTEQARELLQAALPIDENAYGSDHPSVARDCNSLALVEAELGQTEEARRLMRRAWTIRKSKYGPAHRRTKVCQRWLIDNDPDFQS